MNGRTEQLASLYDEGRRAWPGIELEREVFDARAAALVVTGDETLNAHGLYLAFACAEGDPRAVDELDRRYISQVPMYLARLRKPAAFVEDVTQRLREKLLVGSPTAAPRIGAYAGRGSLEGWLSVVATRLALDVADSERRHVVSHDAPDEEALGVSSDPELAYIRQRYLPQFREAFATAMAMLAVEERNLLRFYLIDGLNIAQIGTIFGKSRATIGRWLVETRGTILRNTKQALAGQLGSAHELSSLLRVLHSQLDVSMREYLGTSR